MRHKRALRLVPQTGFEPVSISYRFLRNSNFTIKLLKYVHPQPCVPLQLARGFSVVVHDLKGTRSGGKNWSRTNTLWFFRPALRPLKLSTHIMIVFPISQEVDYADLKYLHTYPRGTFHNLYTTRLCSLFCHSQFTPANDYREGSSYPLTIQFKKVDKTTDNLLICAVHCASRISLKLLTRMEREMSCPFATF